MDDPPRRKVRRAALVAIAGRRNLAKWRALAQWLYSFPLDYRRRWQRFSGAPVERPEWRRTAKAKVRHAVPLSNSALVRMCGDLLGRGGASLRHARQPRRNL